MWRCLSDDANWCCCEKFVRVDEETEKKNLFLIGQLGKCRVTKLCVKLDVLNPKCYYLFLKGKSSFLTVNSPSKTTEFSVQLLFDFNTPVGTASQLPFFFLLFSFTFFSLFFSLLVSFFSFFFSLFHLLLKAFDSTIYAEVYTFISDSIPLLFTTAHPPSSITTPTTTHIYHEGFFTTR